MCKWVLIALFAFTSAICAAHPNIPDCEALLKLKPLRWTIQPEYAIELKSAGIIIPAGRQIPILAPGFYTYLVLKNEDILLAPKYNVKQFMETEKGLATHKSVLYMYEEIRGKLPADMVALGGEFQSVPWLIVDISNRSGNFKSTPRRYEIAQPYLRSRGFLFVDGVTNVRSIDPKVKEDRGHTPEDRNFDEFKLNRMARVEEDKDGPWLRDLYYRLNALAAESFPEAKGKDVIDQIKIFAQKGAAITNETRGIYSFHYPLNGIYNRDGLDFEIAKLVIYRSKTEFRGVGGKPDYFYLVPTQINNIIVGAGDTFSEEIKEKWRALADDFSKH